MALLNTFVNMQNVVQGVFMGKKKKKTEQLSYKAIRRRMER